MGNARFTIPLGKARKTWTQELGGGGSGCRDTEVS